MKKLIGIMALAFLFPLPSTYAQTTNFFELVKTGTPQSIQAAIDQGAEVNVLNKDVTNNYEVFGLTPLMLAAEYNQNPEAVTVLLQAGADLRAKDQKIMGMTALMYAANNQNPEVITTLLKAGADVMARDEGGETVLTLAARKQSPEVITTLLRLVRTATLGPMRARPR